MDLVIVLVRFGKLLFAQKQVIEPLALTQLEFLVHLDRFERTDLDANLAAHADRDVDVEHSSDKTAVCPCNRASCPCSSRCRCTAADIPSRKSGRPRSAGPRADRCRRKSGRENCGNSPASGLAFLRVLHRDQAILLEVTSDKVPRRDGHSFEDACANVIDPLLPSQYRRCRGLPSRPRPCGRGTCLRECVRLMKLGGRTR